METVELGHLRCFGSTALIIVNSSDASSSILLEMKLKISRFLTVTVLLILLHFGNADDPYQQPPQEPTDFKKLFQEWDEFEYIRKSHLKVYGMNVRIHIYCPTIEMLEMFTIQSITVSTSAVSDHAG